MFSKKILIVNDSPLQQNVLLALTELNNDYTIVGVASDGQEAINMNLQHKPDIILMDINMTGINGVEATRQIMQNMPSRILIVTGTITLHMTYIFDAQMYGAMDAMKMPVVKLDEQGRLSQYELKRAGHELLYKINILLKLPVPQKNIATIAGSFIPIKRSPPLQKAKRIVVIGASTGGPKIVLEILKPIHKLSGTAIIIVQHIMDSFAESFVSWLKNYLRMPIKIAQNGEVLQENTIYVAPGGKKSLRVQSEIHIIPTPNNLIYSPNINITMESVANVFKNKCMGIVLSGLGNDGASGLSCMRRQGAYTCAQDKTSCLIDVMPSAAIDSGGAVCRLTPSEMTQKIISWSN